MSHVGPKATSVGVVFIIRKGLSPLSLMVRTLTSVCGGRQKGLDSAILYPVLGSGYKPSCRPTSSVFQSSYKEVLHMLGIGILGKNPEL